MIGTTFIESIPLILVNGQPKVEGRLELSQLVVVRRLINAIVVALHVNSTSSLLEIADELRLFNVGDSLSQVLVIGSESSTLAAKKRPLHPLLFSSKFKMQHVLSRALTCKVPHQAPSSPLGT